MWCFAAELVGGTTGASSNFTPRKCPLHPSSAQLEIRPQKLRGNVHGQSVNSTPNHAHLTHANIFSRVAQEPERGSARIVFLCLLGKVSHLHPHRSLLLDFPSLPLPHGALSLLFPLHPGTHCDPHFGGPSGRWAEQSPLAGEPNDRVERVSVRLTIPARTSPLRLCLRKWMRDKARECWLHRCLPQKREASAAPSRFYHSNREKSVSRSSHIPVKG